MITYVLVSGASIAVFRLAIFATRKAKPGSATETFRARVLGVAPGPFRPPQG